LTNRKLAGNEGAMQPEAALSTLDRAIAGWRWRRDDAAACPRW
jgi:hypothetical protein